MLALDVGSSSVRAILYDSTAQPVEGLHAQRAYAFRTGQDGGSEIAVSLILEAIGACLDEIAPHLPAETVGVALTTFVGSLLGVDDKGTPLIPLITYADTRASASVRYLQATLDETTIHQRTGCYLHAAYWPARLLWLREHRPRLNKPAHWVTLGEYIELMLFGTARVSFSAASWNGLLNRRTLSWDEGLLSVLPITSAQLSPLVERDQPLTGLREPFASRWPALSRIPWFPAVGDGAAANIGMGCMTQGHVAISIGTSSAVRTVMTGDVGAIPEGLWCYRVDASRSLLGGALSDGGNVYAWLSAALADTTPPLAVQPDAHGLTVLPLLAGERTPGVQSHLKAAMTGYTLATSSADIVQAHLEAVAYRIRLLVEQLPTVNQLRASGGALTQSSAWAQILCDVLGQPLKLPAAYEAAARGAALLAFDALGVPTAASTTMQTLTPNMAHHATYSRALERYQRLYDLLHLW